MTNEEILLIAGPEGRDDELVAAAAAHHPRRVTVLIEAHDPSWGWSETPHAAVARRDRLATLLTAVERATGATVVGLVGDPAELGARRLRRDRRRHVGLPHRRVSGVPIPAPERAPAPPSGARSPCGRIAFAV